MPASVSPESLETRVPRGSDTNLSRRRWAGWHAPRVADEVVVVVTHVGIFVIDLKGRTAEWATAARGCGEGGGGDGRGCERATATVLGSSERETEGAARRANLDSEVRVDVHSREVAAPRPPRVHIVEPHLFPIRSVKGRPRPRGCASKELRRREATKLLRRLPFLQHAGALLHLVLNDAITVVILPLRHHMGRTKPRKGAHPHPKVVVLLSAHVFIAVFAGWRLLD